MHVLIVVIILILFALVLDKNKKIKKLKTDKEVFRCERDHYRREYKKLRKNEK